MTHILKAKTGTRHRILAAAAGAVLAAMVLIPSAGAQQRIQTGNANDANNRIGSGGYNTGGNNNRGPYVGYTANDIVTGNVTGAKAFRGPVPYRSTYEFTGPVAGLNTDRFIRDSSGTPYAGTGGYNSNAFDTRTYYGNATLAELPPGFVPQGNTGGFIRDPNAMARSGADLRLGNPFDTNLVAQARPGQLMLPGPVDASNNDTLLTASPLYGVRSWRTNDPQAQQFVQKYTDLYNYNTLGRSALDDTRMRQYRSELFGEPTTQPGGAFAPSARPNNDQVTDQSANLYQGAVNVGAKPIAPGEIGSTQLTNTLQPQQTGAVALDSTALGTSQSFGHRVIPPAQQSSQYAALQERMKRYAGDRELTDVEKARLYNEQMKLAKADREAAAAGKAPRTGQPDSAIAGAGTGASAEPGGLSPTEIKSPLQPMDASAPAINVPGPSLVPGAQKPKPPQVSSMQSLINPKAKGVGEILKTAEDLMRQGKFIDALDQYDTAEQVGAKFAAVQLGRANAELGASYYARAESDLQQAFTSDQSLLEAQYDLGAMIGQERLQFLVKDLKEIANKEKAQSRPLFLLAYIAYNTGNERMAAGYLDLAEKRAAASGSGAESFYKLVKSHWVLPGETTPTNEPAANPPSPAPEPESKPEAATDAPATAPSTPPAPDLNK